MRKVIAQISVTRPREWVLDAQRRFDVGDQADKVRPWSDLARARLAVFRAFAVAFGTGDRDRDPQGVCRGGICLLRVGHHFAPVSDARRALGAIEDVLGRLAHAKSAPRSSASLLDEIELASVSLADVARRDNATRPHIGQEWANLALSMRQLVGDARTLFEEVQRFRGAIELAPGLPPVPKRAREIRSSACARLGALAKDAPSFAALFCPPSGVAVVLLMLLEIAFEVSRATGPFDEPAGGDAYKRRCDAWGKAWSRHAGLRSQRTIPARRRHNQRT